MTSANLSETTIFEALRNDHQTQRRLVDLVSKTHGDSSGRRELFARLKTESMAHAKVEERVFYSVLLGDELTRDKAGHSVKEHCEIESLFNELEQRSMDDSGWLLRFKALADKLVHHMDEEEREMFQLGGKGLNHIQKVEMARAFESEKTAQLSDERDG